MRLQYRVFPACIATPATSKRSSLQSGPKGSAISLILSGLATVTIRRYSLGTRSVNRAMPCSLVVLRGQQVFDDIAVGTALTVRVMVVMETCSVARLDRYASLFQRLAFSQDRNLKIPAPAREDEIKDTKIGLR